MEFQFKESLKVAFAIAGGVMLFYQGFVAVVNKTPLRAVVNPHRRAYLLAGFTLISLGYSALAILAGNRWSPDEIWPMIQPLFNQEATPFRVIAAVGLLGFGSVVLIGSAVFCYLVYPRDPKTFTPAERHPKAIRTASMNALYHFTNRRGGLEYAGVIVLSSNESVPTAEQLVATTTADVSSANYGLIECLDRKDVDKHIAKWERPRANAEELQKKRLGWLTLAVTALKETRPVATQARVCDLGEVTQVRTKSQYGGLLFEYLLPRKDGEPEVILFGVTASADEVANGRLELHFSMLKEALRLIIRETADLGKMAQAASVNRTGTMAALPNA